VRMMTNRMTDSSNYSPLRNRSMAETDEEESPTYKRYNAFENTAQMLAYLCKDVGIDAFSKWIATKAVPVPEKPWLLTGEQRDRIHKREFFEEIVADLKAHGLKKLARIVQEVAQKAPREVDLPPYEPGSIGHRDWLARMKRQGKC